MDACEVAKRALYAQPVDGQDRSGVIRNTAECAEAYGAIWDSDGKR